jgi:DNA-binding transcriptional LysR family regulator
LWGYKLRLYLVNETVHDLGALRALREVGRHGSIASAALVLGVTQQALSARMRNLERSLGITLLARTPTGSRLTEQGQLIVGWGEDVLEAADRLEAGLRSIRSGVSHRLAIAASQTIAEHLVPHWLVELRGLEQGDTELVNTGLADTGLADTGLADTGLADTGLADTGLADTGLADTGLADTGHGGTGQAPDRTPTVVELAVANSTGVIEQVRDVKVRLGFIETPHLPPDLVTAHVRDDEMLVVTAPGHPWARRRSPVLLAELAATPLVMREAGSGTRVTLTDHLAAQDPPLRPRIAMELGTSAAVRSAIAAGVGPGVLSRLAVRDDLVLGRLVAIEVAGPPLIRPLTAVWRPDLDPLPPEGARLLAVAKGIPA